jgi:uncharacterized membrane protein
VPQAKEARATLNERNQKLLETEKEMAAVAAELAESTSALKKAKQSLSAMKTQVQLQLKELQQTSALAFAYLLSAAHDISYL